MADTKLTTVKIIKDVYSKFKKISFDSEVKTTGDYTATLDLHKDVKHKIAFSVVGE